MKNLKYIKLYEAFDSNILSKTLRYINKEDKKNFLDIIKVICEDIDFPISELSDEYFEYLPFKPALNRNIKSEDRPCTAKSTDIFGKYAIEGETCHGGRIKRKWGERPREVTCTVCGGTGIKPKRSNIELIKFWFNTDGKYIATTAVDGIIRPSTGRADKVVDFDSLENGKRYLMRLRYDDPDLIEGTIYKKDGNVFFIQNVRNGGEPRGRDWQKYGKHSWNITGGTSYKPPIYSVEDSKVEDAYGWNVGVAIGKYKIAVNDKNAQNIIKDANFAIILDFEKLKSKEFQKRSKTKETRQIMKAHSLLDPEQRNENIKKRNIEKYIENIIKNTNITDNISNCNRVISRILTYNSSLYIIRYTDITSDLQSILRKYIDILDPNVSDNTKESYAKDINNRIGELSKRNMSMSNSIQNNTKALKSLLLKNKPPYYETHIKMIDKIDEISLVISRNIRNYDVKTIEDFEIIFQKIKTIKDIIRSDRYRMSNFFDYFPSYICQNNIDRAHSFLVRNDYFDPNRVEYDLDRIKSILNRI